MAAMAALQSSMAGLSLSSSSFLGQPFLPSLSSPSYHAYGRDNMSAFYTVQSKQNTCLSLRLREQRYLIRFNHTNIKKAGKKEHHLWMKRDSAGSGQKALDLVQIQRWTQNAQCSSNRSLNIKKAGKKEHHLWMKRDSAGSGQKALNLVQIVSKLPNEKEAIYGALDKWSAWETEFPVIAAAKALEILRRRNQWLRIIQVTKWLLSKGQVLTMGTFDTLLLALDMDQRVGEAETIWNVILQTHTRSVSKRLFSRMISLYDHHHIPEKIVEIFADMEELGVKPDDDTVRRIARAFEKLGQEENQKLLLKRYQNKWKYLHFNGERVRVRNPKYLND